MRVKNTRMLEKLLANVAKAVAGVERTETIIALWSLKEASAIPTRESDGPDLRIGAGGRRAVSRHTPSPGARAGDG